MNRHVVLLSIPALRASDLPHMPQTTALFARGGRTALVPSFPCVTWPVQANLVTGRLPAAHGVVANGFYWRDEQQVEMWTAWNERIESPQVWDLLHQHDRAITSAVWFPMLSKGCGAELVCMPAPVHNPDGSETLWCYTQPSDLYGTLREQLGDFPLHHFWGPAANVRSTAWIADSAVLAAAQHRPHFMFIYLPHLDYAAQKHGPDSPQAIAALGELDSVVGRLSDGLHAALGDDVVWLAASEYAIVSVDHVTYPNRVLRQAGLLHVTPSDDGEQLDLTASNAWALVDHQLAHVFVRGADPPTIDRVAELFRGRDGIAEVLVGRQRDKYGVGHARSGEVVLVSAANSWQAYYWWFDDALAPAFARTVDIHRKPGYDPVELHFDPANQCIPLDATLVNGSHGAPAVDTSQQGVLLGSVDGLLPDAPLRDIDLTPLVLRLFGVEGDFT